MPVTAAFQSAPPAHFLNEAVDHKMAHLNSHMTQSSQGWLEYTAASRKDTKQRGNSLKAAVAEKCGKVFHGYLFVI